MGLERERESEREKVRERERGGKLAGALYKGCDVALQDENHRPVSLSR